MSIHREPLENHEYVPHSNDGEQTKGSPEKEELKSHSHTQAVSPKVHDPNQVLERLEELKQQMDNLVSNLMSDQPISNIDFFGKLEIEPQQMVACDKTQNISKKIIGPEIKPETEALGKSDDALFTEFHKFESQIDKQATKIANPKNSDFQHFDSLVNQLTKKTKLAMNRDNVTIDIKDRHSMRAGHLFQGGKSAETQNALMTMFSKISKSIEDGHTTYTDKNGDTRFLSDLANKLLDTRYAQNVIKQSPKIAEPILKMLLTDIQKADSSKYEDMQSYSQNHYKYLTEQKHQDPQKTFEFLNELSEFSREINADKADAQMLASFEKLQSSLLGESPAENELIFNDDAFASIENFTFDEAPDAETEQSSILNNLASTKETIAKTKSLNEFESFDQMMNSPDTSEKLTSEQATSVFQDSEFESFDQLMSGPDPFKKFSPGEGMNIFKKTPSNPFNEDFKKFANLAQELNKGTKLVQYDDGSIVLRERSNARIGEFFQGGKSKKTQAALENIFAKINDSMQQGHSTYIDNEGNEHHLIELIHKFTDSRYAQNVMMHSPAIATSVGKALLKEFEKSTDLKDFARYEKLNNAITEDPVNLDKLLGLIKDVSTLTFNKAIENDFEQAVLTENSSKRMHEIFTTELNFAGRVAKLGAKDWSLSLPIGAKGTVFDALLDKGIISKSEHSEFSAGWDKLAYLSHMHGEKLRKIYENSDLTPNQRVKAFMNQMSPLEAAEYYDGIREASQRYEPFIAVHKKISNTPDGANLLDQFRMKYGNGLDAFFIDPAQRGPRHRLLIDDLAREVKNASPLIQEEFKKTSTAIFKATS